jgi:hypothetical protein
MKKIYFLILILSIGLKSYSQRQTTPIGTEPDLGINPPKTKPDTNSSNYLTFTPVSQNVSGNSGEEIEAQVLVNCYGGSNTPVFFNINFCSVPDGYLFHSTDNGYILYPGQNSTITFKFKKTVTSPSTIQYVFRKDNGNCTNNSSLISINVTYNYTPPPTCTLIPSVPLISNITSATAFASWTNVVGNNGYILSYLRNGSQNWNYLYLNPNQTSVSIFDLVPEATYQCRLQVKCINNVISQSVWGQPFTTLPCIAPTPIVNDASEITKNSAKITWQTVPGNNTYRIFVKRTNENEWIQFSTSLNSTSRTLNRLQWNTTYEYKVATKCGSQNGDPSEVKTFTTLDSPDLDFPDNVFIATISNVDSRVALHYPDGLTIRLINQLDKIDIYNSEYAVGRRGNQAIFLKKENNSTNDGFQFYWSEYDKILPNNLEVKDISIGKPFKYNNIVNNNYPTYVIASDNNIYSTINGFQYQVTNWTHVPYTISSGPWTGQLRSIEAVSHYGFYLMDSNRNCVRCDRNFIGNNIVCYPISNYNGSNEAIGAAFENYNETPPANTPSFYNAMYRVENNNSITYHYNFGDNESLQIPKPNNEPDYCSNCSIDGFTNNYGQPSNLVFLPNNDGYYYDGTNWSLVAQNIKDISIGQFNRTIGLRQINNVLSEDVNKDQKNIILSPIPASESLQIKIDGYDSSKLVQVTLIDQSGKILSSFDSSNNNNINLDLNKYKDGIYFLKILIEDELITRKIIIRH